MGDILRSMLPKWMGTDYDLLHKNCCSFSDTFAKELGVGEIPQWVHHLADVGAGIDDGVHSAVKELHHVEHVIVEDVDALLHKLHPRRDSDAKPSFEKKPTLEPTDRPA